MVCFFQLHNTTHLTTRRIKFTLFAREDGKKTALKTANSCRSINRGNVLIFYWCCKFVVSNHFLDCKINDDGYALVLVLSAVRHGMCIYIYVLHSHMMIVAVCVSQTDKSSFVKICVIRNAKLMGNRHKHTLKHLYTCC